MRATPLAFVPPRDVREAATRLLRETLGAGTVAYVHTPGSPHGNYRCLKREPTVDDLERHFCGASTTGVAKARRLLSIDLDIGTKGTEASDEEKAAALRRLYEATPSLTAMPHVVADSARGLHVHVFLAAELAGKAPTTMRLPGGPALETFGAAGKGACIRLPFGCYAGKGRVPRAARAGCDPPPARGAGAGKRRAGAGPSGRPLRARRELFAAKAAKTYPRARRSRSPQDHTPGHHPLVHPARRRALSGLEDHPRL